MRSIASTTVNEHDFSQTQHLNDPADAPLAPSLMQHSKNTLAASFQPLVEHVTAYRKMNRTPSPTSSLANPLSGKTRLIAPLVSLDPAGTFRDCSCPQVSTVLTADSFSGSCCCIHGLKRSQRHQSSSAASGSKNSSPSTVSPGLQSCSLCAATASAVVAPVSITSLTDQSLSSRNPATATGIAMLADVYRLSLSRSAKPPSPK